MTLSVPAAYLPVVDSPWSQAPSRKVKQYKEEIFHKSLFFTSTFLKTCIILLIHEKLKIYFFDILFLSIFIFSNYSCKTTELELGGF